MEEDGYSGFAGRKNSSFSTTGSRTGKRVLLREPEMCPECGMVYISLYALKQCADHYGLDELFKGTGKGKKLGL